MKAVDRLAPWGSTALYDTILRSVEMLGRQAGRKVLVIFTDGEDQGSHATIKDVERRLQSSDVTLYMIGQGRGVTTEGLRKIMQRLSAPTGGRALFTDSIDELHDAFGELLDELSNQYLLGYPPTNAHHDDAWHRIKVDVDGYHQIHNRMCEFLTEKLPRPEDMKPDTYKRNIAARAFDVARYTLFFGIPTGDGQVTSIRTLEKQMRRLKASESQNCIHGPTRLTPFNSSSGPSTRMSIKMRSCPFGVKVVVAVILPAVCTRTTLPSSSLAPLP